LKNGHTTTAFGNSFGNYRRNCSGGYFADQVCYTYNARIEAVFDKNGKIDANGFQISGNW